MQVEVVSARFFHSAFDYYFSPNGLEVKKGDYAIVETERGRDIVKIVKDKQQVEMEELVEPLKNVVKVASPTEVEEAVMHDQKAAELLPEIKKLVQNNKLEMKVISVEGNYNGSKLTVNFTAENRVDFRELVKQLAEKYKMRVELRQIGPREATKILGGFGPCGKECCCAQGIGVNDHVSIKMAKNQGLSLNPNSISGTCGKLLCCLSYENPYYVEVLKEMPKLNSFVSTCDGQGKVVYCDLMRKTVDVKFQTENSSEIKNYELKDIKFKKENQ